MSDLDTRRIGEALADRLGIALDAEVYAAALGADNPLRSAADLTAAFTVSPLGWDEWARDMYDRLVVRRDLQLWWKFGFRPSRWAEAADALDSYLRRGGHTDDLLRQGICTRLADIVNREVP